MQDWNTDKSVAGTIRRSVRATLFAFAAVMVVLGTLLPAAYGNPVAGEVFDFTQPTGETVKVKIWGDEFYRVLESLDGYTLVRDPVTQEACYAVLSDDGNELVSTGVPLADTLPAGLALKRHIRINLEVATAIGQAGRDRFAEHEAQVAANLRGDPSRSPPDNGNVSGIVLLVDFDDDPWTIPAQNVDDYCNKIGYTGYGNNGSVRDYFHDVSDGNLTYTNYVGATYYRAQLLKSYYEDPSVSFGTRARELIIAALTDLELNGFDFSQYDSNNDGLVDGINCFYAGNVNGGWAEGLWPHSSSISFEVDGVSTFRYQITNLGSQLRLRTFCHENGHMIGYWPDLYDYGYDSTGVGTFCLMCYGTSSTNPQEPCAYMKYLAGWSTVTTLTASTTGLTVPANSNVTYKMSHPTDWNEYYLIENRQQSGRDNGLPDAGLAIWHVDEYGSNNHNQATPTQHYECTLVQADGNWDLEHNWNSGDSTDLWSAPGYTECGPDTNPDTGWWAGDPSGYAVTNISNSSSVMTFDFSRCQPANCSDDNVCTDDVCNGGVCEYTNNSLPCTDGSFCSGAETCGGGACLPGTPPCQPDVEVCSESAQQCFPAPGACCAPDGSCAMGSLYDCGSAAGFFYGPGVDCADILDPTCTPTSTRLNIEAASIAAAPAGGSLDVEIQIENVTDLALYQATIAITPLSGTGTLTVDCSACTGGENEPACGVRIDTSRPDYVFDGLTDLAAVSCDVSALGALALDGGATVTAAPAYLGEFTLWVSPDAMPGSQFEVAIANAADVTFIEDSNDGTLRYLPGSSLIVTVVDPSACQAPTVAGEGSRSLLVTPTEPNPHALLVGGDVADASVNCVSLYVQADATLGSSPVFMTPAQWGAVALTGDQIIPDTTYAVRADCGSPGNPELSLPAEATTWTWGDIDNNDLVNFVDINLVVQGFQGDFTNVTLERVDLHPCAPNRVINFSDINWDVRAFQGAPFTDNCAAPCP